MIGKAWWLVLAPLVALGALGVARAQPPEPRTPTTQRNVDAAQFVQGNVEYILLHELAHLLIRDLDVPIVGSEESAADYIATIVLLNAGRFDPAATERAREYLSSTANGLLSTWEVYERSGVAARYWDAHGLTIQRFFNVACLVYGSNPSAFAELPRRVDLPPDRADRCPDEYARAERALDWLLENFGRRPDDPTRTNYQLVIESASTMRSRDAMNLVVSSGMLENTLRLFDERFYLPATFRISFKRCRQAQAGWYPQPRELVFCYELIDYYYSLATTRAASDRPSILE